MVGVLPSIKERGVRNISPRIRTITPTRNELKKPVDAIFIAFS